MSNNNQDDIKSKKIKFIILYSCTIIIIMVIGSAFLISPPEKPSRPIAKQNAILPQVSQKTNEVNNKNSDRMELELVSLNEALAKKDVEIKQLEEKLTAETSIENNDIDKEKDEKINQLEKQLNSSLNSANNNGDIAKDEKIKQLEKQLNAAKNTVNNSGKKGKDENFLKWALSSQSKEVKQLKNENAKLRAQLSDLKKYLQ